MATFNLSGINSATTPIGEKVDYDEIIKSFPASTIIHLNNTMLVAMTMERLISEAASNGKGLYSMKDDGRRMCEQFVTCNKADESIFQVFDVAFTHELEHQTIPTVRIAKRFAKMVVATTNTADIPNMAMKIAIDRVREVMAMKHTVCEELKSTPVFAALVQQTYDNCTEIFKDVAGSSSGN